MHTFVFDCRDAEGELIKVGVDAEDRQSAAQYLTDKGFHLAHELDDLIEESKSYVKNVTVPTEIITVFTRQFANLIASGIPVVRAIHILIKQAVNKKFQGVLELIYLRLNRGLKISQAFTGFPKIFSSLYIALLTVGERSGDLDEMMEKLADSLEKQLALNKKIKSASTYPALIVSITVLLTYFIFNFILPSFLSFFEGMRMPLPVTTKVIMFLTKAVKNPLFIGSIFITIFFIWYSIKLYIKTKRGKLNFDRFLLNLPVIGSLKRKIIMAHVTQTLSVLLTAGIPIMQALDLTTKSIDNEIYKEIFSRVSLFIFNGESFGTSLTFLKNEFHPLMLHLTLVGEETGTLPNMFTRLEQFYSEEVSHSIEVMIHMLEPMMIFFIGSVVGVIAISIFIPLYQILQTMGG
ncbi:MAG: type II secretion system F family protein [Firmicutes bacterium]|nr:type II secretion system F family protein [Bacillota bacterium]